MFKINNLKSKNYYKIISKDEYNGLYFWVDNIYITNQEIEQFEFFYSHYTMPWLESEDDVKAKAVYNDCLYVQDLSETWIKDYIENEWMLYEIELGELEKIQKLESQLFGDTEIRKAW